MDSNYLNRKRRTTTNSKYNNDSNYFDMINLNNIKLGRKRGKNESINQSSNLNNIHQTKQPIKGLKDKPKINTKKDLSDDDSVTFENKYQSIKQNKTKQESNIQSNSLPTQANITNSLRSHDKFITLPNKILMEISNTTDQTSIYHMSERPSGITQIFLYKPFLSLPDLSNYITDLIEVRIASEYITSFNPILKSGRIFGSDIYTSNSDPLLILIHSGFLYADIYQPSYEGIALYFRISKNRISYNASTRYGIKSNKTSSFQGHSIKPEGFSVLTSLGTEENIFQYAAKMPLNTEIVSYPLKYNIAKIKNEDFAYSLTTTPITFNLSFEPSYKYSLSAIIDKSHDNTNEYLSYLLKSKVLYVETNTKRYEIARHQCLSRNTQTDKTINELEKKSMVNNIDDFIFEKYEKFKFSEVNDPYEKGNAFMLSNKVPLTSEYVKELYSILDWSDLKWGGDYIDVRGIKVDKIKTFKFYDLR